MSDLRERLLAAHRQRAATIGFGAARGTDARRHLLVLAQGDGEPLRAALETSVNGALIGDASALADVVAQAGSRPVGLISPGATRSDATAAADAGADFLLIDDASAHAAALLERRLGAVIRIATPISDEELVALRAAGFDALIVAATQRPVTVRAQMDLRRLHALSGTPLLIEITDPVDAETLQVWRDAGVHAVIAVGAALGALPDVLAAADQVPARPSDASDGPSVAGGSPGSLGLR